MLLALGDFGPCKGFSHLPGGTARFGEPVTDAVKRVALDELGLTLSVGRFVVRLAATGSGGPLETQIAVANLRETNYPYTRGFSGRVRSRSDSGFSAR